MKQYPNHRLFVVGELGRRYFSKHGYTIDTHFHYTAQHHTMHRASRNKEKEVVIYMK